MKKPPIKEKFDFLYKERVDFRALVDKLRMMILDPDQPFDVKYVLDLFNEILSLMGLPSTSATYLRPRKTVIVKMLEPPPPPKCVDLEFPELRVFQPKSDVDIGNGFRAVYVCPYLKNDMRVYEVTLVFGDEDKPPMGSIMDIWYGVWRLVAWGRISDIETFYIIDKGDRYEVDFTGLQLVLKETLGVRKIPPIGSGNKRFYEPGHEYEIESAPRDVLNIYVNTWNHGLGLRDNNPNIKKVMFTLEDVEVRKGCRVFAENDVADIKYVSEIPGI